VIDTPQIVQTSAVQAAVIRFTIPKDQIQQVMGPGFGELFSTLQAQGIAPAGPAFSHHFRMDPAVWDFELGVPVASPVTPTGRVKAGTLPAARVARTIYHGGYEGLGPAWGELHAWIVREGHKHAEDFWECYVTGPESGPDPAKYRTELNRPLA
jgi:effector-binding domain-containing protein